MCGSFLFSLLFDSKGLIFSFLVLMAFDFFCVKNKTLGISCFSFLLISNLLIFFLKFLKQFSIQSLGGGVCLCGYVFCYKYKRIVHM